jgi:hypothetical protein
MWPWLILTALALLLLGALDYDVLPVHVTKFAQASHESFQSYAVWTGILRAARRENTYSRYFCSLLQSHDARPRRSGAREKDNELSSPHDCSPEAKAHSLPHAE